MTNDTEQMERSGEEKGEGERDKERGIQGERERAEPLSAWPSDLQQHSPSSCPGLASVSHSDSRIRGFILSSKDEATQFIFTQIQKLNLKNSHDSVPISVMELGQALPAVTHYESQLFFFFLQNPGYIQGVRAVQISSPPMYLQAGHLIIVLANELLQC